MASLCSPCILNSSEDINRGYTILSSIWNGGSGTIRSRDSLFKGPYGIKARGVEWAKIRYEQLNMISERRLAAMCHHQLYQRRMAKAYDKKVRLREFKKGDLVLRKIILLPGEDRSKWAPNYKGPYIVKKAFSGGALILTRMDGEDVVRPVNFDSVKKYYP